MVVSVYNVFTDCNPLGFLEQFKSKIKIQCAGFAAFQSINQSREAKICVYAGGVHIGNVLFNKKKDNGTNFQVEISTILN